MNLFLLALFGLPMPAFAQEDRESEYYRLVSFAPPGDCVLEAGGLDWYDAGKTRLLVCTRRGELWVVDNVYGAALPRFKRMIGGLHEPLGVLVNPGRGYPKGVYVVQRGELSRLVDTNGDDRMDVVEAFSTAWETSGAYHEYAFGPKMGKDGQLWVTLNRQFGRGPEGPAFWRGWALRIDPKGEMTPVCTGLRSPAGTGLNRDGEMFYTDNQGDHVAVGKLGHLKPGVFHGNPRGLLSAGHPKANFKIPFKGYPRVGLPWNEAVRVNPQLQPPAIWFPYPEMGQSQTDVLTDSTGGKFGPFSGQLFVGDLTTAQVMRVVLEKVEGEYQGACFPFRRGFRPPVLRMLWGRDGSLFVAGSNRGWGGLSRPHGLQRVVWTGKVPFEALELRARPDGFELSFTKEVDPETAAGTASYAIEQWHYFYLRSYGDLPHDRRKLRVRSATVASDRKSVRLVVEGMKPHHVVEVRFSGVRSGEGAAPLHPVGYYTLNRIPK